MSGLVGGPAPEFTAEALSEGEITTLSLEAYRGKWLYLLFYPLDFTFVCPTELLAFSDKIKDFDSLNAEVLGVSIDSVYTHLAWTETPRTNGGIEGLQFPLLSDQKRELSQAFGVDSPDGPAYRGLFLIDPDGIVQQMTVNNLPVGRNVEEALRILQAYQHVAEYGDVCPANWIPGETTMVADPKASKDYFSQLS